MADEPTYKGGKLALERFINQHIIYPSFSKSNCLEGVIYVSFQLDSLGNVIKTNVEKGFGIDLDDEAQRVIRLTSGKWIVTPENVKNISMVLPVNFSLENPLCNNITEADKKRAIEYYKIQEGLQNTVFNYYKNKESNQANNKNETDILKLKEELGFNEDFITSKLEEAHKKIAQKDFKSACQTLQIIKNIGSNAANKLLSQYCN